MFFQNEPYYPNHHIRTYCVHLGGLILDNKKYDMGVYVNNDNVSHASVSHAIVFGNDDNEYMSGEFINENKWLDKCFRFQSLLYKLNEVLYKEHLKQTATIGA